MWYGDRSQPHLKILYETSLCAGMLKNTDMVMVEHSKINNNNNNNSNMSNNYYAMESMYKISH